MIADGTEPAASQAPLQDWNEVLQTVRSVGRHTVGVSSQKAITQRLMQALWRPEVLSPLWRFKFLSPPKQWSMQALRVAAQSERAAPGPQDTAVAKISVQAAARRRIRMAPLKHAR